MGGAWHNGQALFASELVQGLAIELEHLLVATADDQEGRGGDPREGVAGEIGPAAAGDHDRDVSPACGSDEGGGGPGGGTEVAYRQQGSLYPGPAGGAVEPLGQEGDVEDIRPAGALRFGEQVKEERPDAGGRRSGSRLLDRSRLLPLPWAKRIHRWPVGDRQEAERQGDGAETDADVAAECGCDGHGRSSRRNAGRA
jgi:hypothetical protein